MFARRLWLPLALATLAPLSAAEKKVLMVTKSVAFEHPVVKRAKPDELSMAEKIVVDLGKKNSIVVEATKNASQLNAENLKNYAGVVFFTQGNLIEKGNKDAGEPMKLEDRPAILDFVKNGGGFLGMHCGGADTFNHKFWVEDGKKPFNVMVGGEFIGHGPQQVTRVDVVDPSFPAVKGWPKSFPLNDEWYCYDGFQKNMHVLMMLETEGMKHVMYERPAYPITWCSNYGTGRVFYTGMGHREDVWQNPLYQSMIESALQWTLKDIEGDASPNLQSLFGDEDKAIERINPPPKKPEDKQPKNDAKKEEKK